MSHPRPYLGRIAIIFMIVGAAAGAGGEDLVTGQLETGASGLTINSDALTNDADQVVIVRGRPRGRIDDNECASMPAQEAIRSLDRGGLPTRGFSFPARHMSSEIKT